MNHEENADFSPSGIYIDREFGLCATKVLPGKYFVADSNTLIVTVLGSCVAVCMWDPVNKIGGMNHFMLPMHTNDPAVDFSPSARYGAYAMEILINDLLKMGAARKNLEAKIFGAGKVLSGMNDIGERNARFALEYLRREKIPITAQDLGGNYPRKVHFFPASGRVLVKLLRSQYSDAIAIEKAYGRELDNTQVGGDVDLFQ
jgi:chemotaxis protein CheD